MRWARKGRRERLRASQERARPAGRSTSFAALGAGMALPMVILSHSSAAVRALPKPGPWMDTAKNLLAFPLYLTAVWLLWVAGSQQGINTMAFALTGLVLLALAAYLYGEGWLRKLSSALLVAVALFLAVPGGDDYKSVNTGVFLVRDEGGIADNSDAEVKEPSDVPSPFLLSGFALFGLGLMKRKTKSK